MRDCIDEGREEIQAPTLLETWAYFIAHRLYPPTWCYEALRRCVTETNGGRLPRDLALRVQRTVF